MALLMRDSVDPFAIPLNGLAAVAGYADGLYTWSSEGWARFSPPIVPLSIVLDAGNVGDILDVEPGGATPSQCPGWADRFDRPNRRLPTIYCNRSQIAEVRRFMGGRPFDWWAATLDGTTEVSGAVVVQYCGAADSADPCRTTGHYDESIIHDEGWIGVPDQGEPADPNDYWWGPYVDDADLVVELGDLCHAPVFEAGGRWLQNGIVIATPQLGEFAEWTLAKRVAGGVWLVMDESGGPQGEGPAGRLEPEEAFWIDDAVTDSTGCGGASPPEVAASGAGQLFRIQ